MADFLNGLLAALGLIGAGIVLYWLLNDSRPDPSDPEADDTNWTEPEDHEQLYRSPK